MRDNGSHLWPPEASSVQVKYDFLWVPQCAKGLGRTSVDLNNRDSHSLKTKKEIPLLVPAL
jgi:hypothetical protein